MFSAKLPVEVPIILEMDLPVMNRTLWVTNLKAQRDENLWLQEQDLNLWPSDYEPDELPTALSCDIYGGILDLISSAAYFKILVLYYRCLTYADSEDFHSISAAGTCWTWTNDLLINSQTLPPAELRFQ